MLRAAWARRRWGADMPFDQFHGVREDGAYMFGDSSTGEVTPMPPNADTELHRASLEEMGATADNSGAGGVGNGGYSDPSHQAPAAPVSVADVGTGGAPPAAAAAPHGGGG